VILSLGSRNLPKQLAMSWKREQIPDHKFDFVDENDFLDNSCGRQISYMGVFLYTLKDILVYMADLASVTLLMIINWENIVQFRTDKFKVSTIEIGNVNQELTENPVIKTIGGVPVLFLLIMSSLVASFVILAFEWKKATDIIRSRDISYAFTSVIAYRFYAIRSYAHYCLFAQIQNSRKTMDVVAFWVFFRFKSIIHII
jgi:hypothetical protein